MCTPPLAGGIVAGVTRAAILELCPALGLEMRETSITPEKLVQTDGVFLSLSSVGIAEAVSLDEKALRRSPMWSESAKLTRTFAPGNRIGLEMFRDFPSLYRVTT